MAQNVMITGTGRNHALGYNMVLRRFYGNYLKKKEMIKQDLDLLRMKGKNIHFNL